MNWRSRSLKPSDPDSPTGPIAQDALTALDTLTALDALKALDTLAALDALTALVAEVMDPGWSRAQLAGALAAPVTRVWLAEGGVGREADASDEGEGLLGFVVARRILDVLEIDLVGTRPEHRKRGIAKGLLRELLATESERGLAEARLELAAGNEPARRLYAALGFVVVGRRSRYYPNGDDALLLSRTHFERRSGSPE